MSTAYCTYLTIYKGNKLPPFYIGYTTVNNIKKGYHGSVSSKKYKEIWKQELKENPGLFDTKVLTVHVNKEEAVIREEDLQRKMNVIHNPLYVNKAIGKHSDRTGHKHSEETKLLIGIKSKGRKSSRKGIKCPGVGGVKMGNIPWNKGKTGVQINSENSKKKQSESLKKTLATKGGTWNKGLKGIKGYTKGLSWFYNPATGERKMFIESEKPEGWVKGSNKTNKDKVWYYNPNNIQETSFLKINTEPKGWLRGRGVTGKRSKNKGETL